MKNKQTKKFRPKKNIKVIELFAGVGGFRLGLEAIRGKNGKKPFNVVWSNQWEPTTKKQHASEIYEKRFGKKGHSNEDISEVSSKKIPTHDLLVGGFPCQDYSVARTLNQADGLVGRKGVLWWEIHRIIKEKRVKPKYLLLENVDRLLKSPAIQRGRDFAIMLASLNELGYAVEWRVINAADYGFPQRRRRVFFIGYHKKSKSYKKADHKTFPIEWFIKEGVFAKAFPCDLKNKNPLLKDNKENLAGNIIHLHGDLADISDNFNNEHPSKTPFGNAGIMINGNAYTLDVIPTYNGDRTNLKDILIDEKDVPEEYYIDEASIDKWKTLKGAKKLKRVNKKTGHEYTYDEGPMVFPDPLNKPSRTVVTGEGGPTPSRFKHAIRKNGKLRRLVPIELERLNMFPDDHTKEATDAKRAFFMGNALVVGVVERIGKELFKEISRL